jgi:hypothetical protein
MLVRLSTAIAAICMLSGAALAQGAAKPTDSQIAHIAYTAGQLEGTSKNIPLWCDDRRSSSQRGRSFNP